MNRRAILSDPEAQREYEEAYLVGEVTDTISALLQGLGLSQADLAGRLGVTKGRVSQILSGRQNMTLRTLAAIGWALGVTFDLSPRPMADRAGTPAAADPGLPDWVSQGDQARRRRVTASREH
ncbi:MAG: helix-turn-helix transcriptional regulator [Acidimicrobiia bacterium]|nr:helix-turn-helix transcriptional regulator [Acidimicrobiia bacterium]